MPETPSTPTPASERPDPPRTPLASLLISAELSDRLAELRRSAHRFGAELKNTILAQRPEESDALLQSASASTQRLFSKWNLEILYTLAFTPNARFSELKRRLGPISSRTLSNKLKELETEGYLDRRVTTTRPLRVDYALTEEGLNIAALTAPLVAHLNERYTAREHPPRTPSANNTANNTATDTANHAAAPTVTREATA